MLAFLLPLTKTKAPESANLDKVGIEEKLISGLLAGDKLAVKQLYRQYAPSLLGVIKRIVKFDEIAEDLLQDVFVKIWKSISTYDSNKGKLFTWMVNLTRNLAIDYIRSKSALKDSKTDDISELLNLGIEPFADGSEKTDTIGIKNLIGVLKKDQKIIIDLIYFQGFTHVQVSEELNIPLGTVKTKLRLAILQLRKHFIELKISA